MFHTHLLRETAAQDSFHGQRTAGAAFGVVPWIWARSTIEATCLPWRWTAVRAEQACHCSPEREKRNDARHRPAVSRLPAPHLGASTVNTWAETELSGTRIHKYASANNGLG